MKTPRFLGIILLLWRKDDSPAVAGRKVQAAESRVLRESGGPHEIELARAHYLTGASKSHRNYVGPFTLKVFGYE